MKILAGLLILISLATVQPKAEAYYRTSSYYYSRPTYQYQQINGYYRSNGTYVQPHYRGVQNSVKYDNLNYYYKNLNGRRVYPNR